MVGSGEFLVILLFWMVPMFWVMLDASKNSSNSAVLWGLVVFLGGLLGALIYYLVGRDRPDDDRSRGQSRGSRFRNRTRGTPSHVCASCGEEYYTDPSREITSCRNCGGIKIERGGERDRDSVTPSHVCRNCGEEYFTSGRVDTCRDCGEDAVERSRAGGSPYTPD